MHILTSAGCATVYWFRLVVLKKTVLSTTTIALVSQLQGAVSTLAPGLCESLRKQMTITEPIKGCATNAQLWAHYNYKYMNISYIEV